MLLKILLPLIRRLNFKNRSNFTAFRTREPFKIFKVERPDSSGWSSKPKGIPDTRSSGNQPLR